MAKGRVNKVEEPEGITVQERINAAENLRREWCEFLLDAIQTTIVDEAKTLPGSEAVVKSPWTEQEMDALKGKMFFLLRQIPLYNPDKHQL